MGAGRRGRSRGTSPRVFADRQTQVIVDADEVDRHAQSLQFVLIVRRPGGAKQVVRLFGYPSQERRIEKLAVDVGVHARRRASIGVGVAGGPDGRQIDHQADLPVFRRAIGVDGGRMGAEQIQRDACRFGPIAAARGVHAGDVAVVDDDPRLVDRHPHRHPVAKRLKHDLSVVGEPAGRVAMRPAATILERRRQIPVVECRTGLNLVVDERIHQSCVEVKSALVGAAGSLRQCPRPGDAEAIRLRAELTHECDVVGKAAIVITGHVAVVAASDHAGAMREAMPDARPGAVGKRRTLDLIGRSRQTPQKVAGKTHRVRTLPDCAQASDPTTAVPKRGGSRRHVRSRFARLHLRRSPGARRESPT